VRFPRTHPLSSALAVAASLVLAGTAAAASPGAQGGGAAFSKAEGGGARFGTTAKRVDARPGLALLRVRPQTLRVGRLPEVRFRIVQRGTRRVRVRVAIVRAGDGTPALRVRLGTRRTGRLVAVRWPRGARLAPGRYAVRLHATDAAGNTLRQSPQRARGAIIRVKPKPKRKPKPTRTPRPKPVTAPPSTSPTPTPAAPPSTSGVFPVRGWFTFGGDGSVFGAARSGHTHQGQDIAAAAGTPVVAPTAGTVTVVSFQRRGAGFYVVMAGDDGRDFFFAHLQKGSIVVAPGQRVRAGTQLGRVGSTGASSGPHLHFEIWVGGWQRGRPIDPIAQLRAWAR
jgi:murein DD-endopeptidase MepM/ murein hydrolase activator NlpD